MLCPRLRIKLLGFTSLVVDTHMADTILSYCGQYLSFSLQEDPRGSYCYQKQLYTKHPPTCIMSLLHRECGSARLEAGVLELL